MNDNIYQPPESDVDPEARSDKSFVQKAWHRLNKTWFFATVFAFVVIGVFSSTTFEAWFSGMGIDLLNSLAYIVAGIWWVVHDQSERDSDTPTLLIVGMVLLPILAFPIYCFWSRGIGLGSLQLLKGFIYVVICTGLQIGTAEILNLAAS